MITSDTNSIRRIGVEMHGVRLNLCCDYDRLVDHLCILLEGYIVDPWDDPDITVNGQWLRGAPEQGVGPLAPAEGYEQFGKRMWWGQDGLMWPDTHRHKDMRLAFYGDDTARVFDVAYWFKESVKKTAKYGDYEQKKFFDMLRYFVLFPIAWHLERTRNWILIHASAVAKDNDGILIAGAGGAGKTTTSLALMSRAGMSMITENLLFTDGENIHSLCEPIRLTEESLALLGDDVSALQPLNFPGGSKRKTLFRLPADPAGSGWKSKALFIPRFSETGYVRRMTPGIACEVLGATNRLTLELDDYYWYTAALDLRWPHPGHRAAQQETLRKLTANTACYELGIDRSAGVGPVVDQILESTGRKLPVEEVKA